MIGSITNKTHSKHEGRNIVLHALCVLSVLMATSLSALADKVYQSPADFVKSEFAGKVPSPRVQSLSAEMQKRITQMNGRKYAAQRVRYWSSGSKTVYILNSIGKTQPITCGYVLEGKKLSKVKVLVYRESHGDEVSRSYFTKQFRSLTLKKNGKLSRKPGNIAGATMSVRSLQRMARVALYLESNK